VLLGLAVGCGDERSALHEIDHYVPPHWPSSLSDGAAKIDRRLAVLRDAATAADQRRRAAQELTELAQWMPEIAADTDLSEADWLPIYHQCRQIEEAFARAESSTDAWVAPLMHLSDLLKSTEAQLQAAAIEQAATGLSPVGDARLAPPPSIAL
jgi:hypothetical protein